jgi:Rv0623-like transcription factor
MALSIKTAEADELARSLAHLTGGSMTEAVTISLSGVPLTLTLNQPETRHGRFGDSGR